MEENTIFQPSASSVPQSTGGQQPAEQVQPQPAQESRPHISIMTIVKAILGVLVILVVGFLLVNFVFSKLSKKSEAVTLTYWGLWEDQNIFKGVIEDFQKQNPNITVNYIKQDIKDYRERLMVRTQNGTGPDIFRFHNTWIPQLSNIVLPLPKDIVTVSEFQNNYFLVTQTDIIKNGALYGVPLGIDTLSLFINLDLFKSAGYTPPTNWDDFLRIARGLTVKDESGKIKTSGASMGTFDNVNHAPDIISMLMLQNGTNVRNISENPKAASEALLFYVSFAKPPDNVWDQTLEQSLTAFAKGKAGMYFGYSWDVFTIKALNPNLAFDVKEVPHLFGRNITTASYWIEGVNVKSKHQKEALLFLKHLAQKQTAEKLFTTESKTRLFGEPYARIDSAETLKSNPLVYPFVKQAKTARSSFFAADTFDNGFNSRMNVYLGNAVRSMLDNTSAETATDTLASGVNQVLNQYEPKPQK
ncbi:MAG: hypothetical protein A3F31_02495 [Candidatus Levybacteria bacterium RIFCSPHIGHO2_12_FULL_38_12]|nr:MAG: hypothetical protein A3D75_02110 [Candidatus Levybacteria bacterium RIFCSPHIGHO2_02_FULL_37_18]OGH22376.1 MAG: hypothetical protein A3F31_02495 [Candidatus Levybacteria bacterium RIFCSPHIGHO2_12_FULL_38_12]OGH33619.1 MAG: hypothetical protein A3A47_02200 [Candidatus Levybacteria bacterium RIFCSPLOWO2_01_FULL_37_20]OGH44300.1 MAG: hypothetical protein A3J14_03800 [Candidatus Levybacteria bacterium RIFCSPLOWO2_02_FULL_37_18]